MKIQVHGVEQLIGKLKRYTTGLEEKKRRFLEQLAELGIETATVAFSKTEYVGNNDVVVSPPEWVDENTIAVVASGRALLFIEFGTGLVGYGHELGEEFGYVPGSWSDDESKGGKHLWNKPEGWWYGGVKTHGNAPARAMYEASKIMRDEIQRIAREVFTGD